MKTKNVATAMAFTLFAGFAAPAFAGQADGVKSIEVDIADLDLNTPEDQAIAERRIDRAAKKACNVGGMWQALSVVQRERKCVAIAKADALASIHRPKSRIADTGASPEG